MNSKFDSHADPPAAVNMRFHVLSQHLFYPLRDQSTLDGVQNYPLLTMGQNIYSAVENPRGSLLRNVYESNFVSETLNMSRL